jgi:hypothetical protein
LPLFHFTRYATMHYRQRGSASFKRLRARGGGASIMSKEDLHLRPFNLNDTLHDGT